MLRNIVVERGATDDRPSPQWAFAEEQTHKTGQRSAIVQERSVAVARAADRLRESARSNPEGHQPMVLFLGALAGAAR